MTIIVALLGCFLLALVGTARLLFLARGRAGWAMYLANVVWETASKKLGVGRSRLEAATAALGLALLRAGGISWMGVMIAGVALLVMEIMIRQWERKLLVTAYVRQGGSGPAPTAAPRLILTLEAPFVERLPRYQLGTLWVGVPFDIEVIVGNHSVISGDKPVQLRLFAPPACFNHGNTEIALGPIAAGEVSRTSWRLCPTARSGGGRLEITLESDGIHERFLVGYDGCQSAAETRIEQATIGRYPGGRRSAFAWRGDMDLYDTVTMQSIAGLETALGLAARYRFPQTLCLSTRLSLDEAAAREWAGHYGVDRGASEIPEFAQWLRENVELRLTGGYPTSSSRKFLMELGNHGHLHYDTATSASPENGWRSHARMGAGRYPWLGPDASSFGEQRDNVLEARRWCERVWGFAPRSWAKPGRCNDGDTARAVEAAGCEVLSGSDIRARDNVLYQPPPHHPGGTNAVELTTRYPCDPQHGYHLAMLLFWLSRSQRLGVPMVYMCHQHMRQFEGQACVRITEYLLRTVLADFHGDFKVDTLFGVGKYWREVLSVKTRRISLTLTGTRLVVENLSDTDFEMIPVDLVLAGGGRSTVLVSVQSGASRTVDLAPHLSVHEGK